VNAADPLPTPVQALTGTRPALGRPRPWPYDPECSQLVVIDHTSVPGVPEILRRVQVESERGMRRVRTSALFPAAAEVFAEAGFHPIDVLTLLEIDLSTSRATSASSNAHRTRRLRSSEFAAAADLDRRAFGDPWGNDAAALADICSATPWHRARAVSVRAARRLAGFCLDGRAGQIGYVQRLAVDPACRRQGVGRALIDDALAWMRRRGAIRAMVNTGEHNAAALALYESIGFRRRAEQLTIMQLDLPAT
jgi:ribosomal protein S18 acetylase RimI-like enzyme